jgi:hypothetical protein
LRGDGLLAFFVGDTFFTGEDFLTSFSYITEGETKRPGEILPLTVSLEGLVLEYFFPTGDFCALGDFLAEGDTLEDATFLVGDLVAARGDFLLPCFMVLATSFPTLDLLLEARGDRLPTVDTGD